MSEIKMNLKEYNPTSKKLPYGYEIINVSNRDKLNRLYKSCGLGVDAKRVHDLAVDGTVLSIVDKSTKDYVCTASFFKRKELSWVGTHPEYRRKGLAIILCTKVINLALEKGYKQEEIIVKTGRSNNHAIEMYMKLGFSK